VILAPLFSSLAWVAVIVAVASVPAVGVRRGQRESRDSVSALRQLAVSSAKRGDLSSRVSRRNCVARSLAR
jgi:hypothetical protein